MMLKQTAGVKTNAKKTKITTRFGKNQITTGASSATAIPLK